MKRLMPVLGLALSLAAMPALAQAPEKKPVEETKAPSLEEAYQKEFAFLASQKRELASQLERTAKSFASRKRGLASELETMELKLLTLENKTRNLRDQMHASEQAVASIEEEGQLVEATLAQAAETLSGYDIDLPEATDMEARIAALGGAYLQVADLLKQRGSQRLETGEFFIKDGTKVNGQIVRLGGIAAYGVHEGIAGALAPAGGGRFKLWPETADDAARALASKGVPDDLPIFLFEQVNRAVSETAQKSVLDHISAGGSIAWVIVMLGLLGLFLIAFRAMLLARSSRRSSAKEEQLVGLVAQDELGQATEVVAGYKNAAGGVLVEVVRGLAEKSEKLEELVAERLLSEQRRLGRFATTILVIAAVSPLLGLLGTVTGMIATFDVITEFGTGDPKMLSGGISTALITTELGLIVAIPTLLFGSLLSGWSSRIESEIEEVVLKVINAHDRPNVHDDEPTEVQPEAVRKAG